MCFIWLLLEAFPFFSKRIVLLLSWNKTLSWTWYPWDSMKYQVQQIAGVKSLAPTISDSVELWVLSFCLVELTMGYPLPKDRLPLLCPRMLGWTANAASTHHFKMPVLMALRISGSVRVPLRYFIRWTSLIQSSLSDACTCVVKNAVAVQVSDLACLVAYSVMATRLWNSTALSGGSFSQSLLTLKRLSGAALDFVPPPLGSALSKALMISST